MDGRVLDPAEGAERVDAEATGDADGSVVFRRASDAARLTTAGYRLLAAFRYEVRKFLAFSEHAARGAGVEPQQHQFLLALRGLPEGARPTVGALAERLCVQPHTAVALVDKLEERRLIRRERGTGDRREVLLRITPAGEAILRKLSSLHREQLASVGPAMVEALDALLNGRAIEGGQGLALGALVDPRASLAPIRPRSPRRATRRHQSPAKGPQKVEAESSDQNATERTDS